MTTRTIGGAIYVTNALTTIFTPPSYCSSILNSYSSWGENRGVLHVLQDGNEPGFGMNSACYPPNFYNHNWYTGLATYGIYSPGVCPFGYDNSYQTVLSDVTTNVCCRSGFDVGTSIIGKCKKATAGPAEIAMGPGSETIVTSLFLAYDWAVTVAWAASDLDAFSPPSAPISRSGTRAATTTTQIITTQPSTRPQSPSRPTSSTPKPTAVFSSSSIGTQTLQPPAPASTTNSISSHTSFDAPPVGLPMAAKAGIGVGAGLGVLLILVLLAILWVLRKRKNRYTEVHASRHQHPELMRSHIGGQQTTTRSQSNTGEISSYHHEDNKSAFVRHELNDRRFTTAELQGN